MANWSKHIQSAFQWGKRRAAIALFCLSMVLGLFSGEALAKGTMGRSGGSFKSAPRSPSSSRMYSPPSRSYSSPQRSYHSAPMYRPSLTPLFYRNPRPLIRIGPSYHVHSHSHLPVYGPPNRRMFPRASEIVLVTGAGLAIAYGVSTKLEKDRQETSSTLGPGFSVAKLTVSLNVPDRDAPNSVLKKLQRISAQAPTHTRKGVQDLISSVALELMRQERSIRSAASFSEKYKNEGETERSYFRQSIQERSKFDDEREYNDGSINAASQRKQATDSSATEAVVTILLAIEGDSTQLPSIKSRDDVMNALNRLAVDAQMDDCLLSGEVSWAPELRSESLSREDIIVDYPTLFPV